MSPTRRQLLRTAGIGLVGTIVSSGEGRWARAIAPTDGNAPVVFDIRLFGAAGDGKTDDTAAINHAIDAAAGAGGGIVLCPAGSYQAYSIRLKSSVALWLEEGSTVLAGSTPLSGTVTGGYDAAEPNTPWEEYQDFGHNHWHNSLIWGEGLHDIAILGPGRIWGKGLSRGHDDSDLPPAEAPGVGNKAVALKQCHNVLLRDFSILAAGHFGILATGVDTLTIDNVAIDTNRDGMNIDCCRNVRITDCTVNSPWDDGICLKSSFALGRARPTENVTITGCYVTGNDRLGTLLAGGFEPFGKGVDAAGATPTGRIKLGTESNGGFRNITIGNCIFESCRGLALETVDGGILEDITVTGLTMRDVRNAPFYLRLGARMRGPQGASIGRLRRVLISGVVCDGPANAMPAIISGIPGHAIEDVRISDVYMLQCGGGSAEEAAIQPPEQETTYPEPSRLGTLPAQHFLIRHARNIELSHITLETATADARPVFWLDDVSGFDAFRLRLPESSGGPAFLLNGVKDFSITASHGIADTALADVARRQF
jgi:polygalacturonase